MSYLDLWQKAILSYLDLSEEGEGRAWSGGAWERSEESASDYEEIRRGWFLGSEEFRQELLAAAGERVGPSHYGSDRHETGVQKADRIVAFTYDTNYNRLLTMTDGIGTTTYGYPCGLKGNLVEPCVLQLLPERLGNKMEELWELIAPGIACEVDERESPAKVGVRTAHHYYLTPPGENYRGLFCPSDNPHFLLVDDTTRQWLEHQVGEWLVFDEVVQQ